MTGKPYLRVLHLLAPAAVGGLERVVQLLTRGQVEVGHSVAVAAIVPSRRLILPFLEPLGSSAVDARVLEVGRRGYLRERRMVGEICEEMEPDVVHTHGYRPDVVDAGIARARGAATVSTVHGFVGGSRRGRLYEWIQKRSLRRFDAVVAVAQPQVDVLRAGGVPNDRIHVVSNALDTLSMADPVAARRRWGVSAEAFHIGWVGRLSPEKGPDVLLDALPALDPHGLTVSLVGDGPLCNELRAKAVEIGVADRVRWHGQVPNAARYFRGFDVLVLSSRTEGTPMVLLEGIAAEVPIIATCVGGVPDVVTSSEAVLVEPDDPRLLASALRRVRLDPDAAGERARAAHQRHVGPTRFREWVERYDDVYREAMRRRG